MIRNIFIMVAVCAMLAESSALVTNRSRRSADTCGVAKSDSSLIVLGQDFPRGSFPWIVALMHTGTRPPKFFCGGSLISKTFVISAAHCILEKRAAEKFLPRDILALFGAHDLSDRYEPETITLSPKKVFIHDDWNHLTASYDADVALLEFWANKIHFDEYIQPICLWSSTVEPTVTESVVTGWGKSEDSTKIHENKPKMIAATIQTNERCFLDTKALVDLSSVRTFCAGLRNGSGVCNGDSGGGLFIKVDDIYYLRGIVSSSLIKDGSCDVSRDAVFTNVQMFTDWIEKITGAAKKVFCTKKIMKSRCCGKLETCVVNQTIDTEDCVVGSGLDTTVKRFVINNREVTFLPRLIGENFPNLIELQGNKCRLTVIRDYYFKDMRNLTYLHLQDNNIVSVDSKAFKDLISLEWLDLSKNMIQTFDENLFATMVKLANVYLENNNIKFLNPTTFKIPGVNLRVVYLFENVCILGLYRPRNTDILDDSRYLDQLEGDLRANCTQ